tara:strand:- start:5431 stop:6405 length:975 start_codon:yes stop_codon:yes gene_type:complete
MIKRFPKIMEGQYKRDPEKFVKNLTCLPRQALNPLIRRFHMVQGMWSKGRENPFNEKTRTFDKDFTCKDSWARYLHIDLAVNHDRAGIAMSHVKGFKSRSIRNPNTGQPDKIERVPLPVVDFVGGIEASLGGEIDYQEIRDLLVELVNVRGFRIRLITFDQFQSVDMKQQLRNLGFIVARMSIDRTTSFPRVDYDKDEGYRTVSTESEYAAPFICVREAIYEGRLDCPFHMLLAKEMRGSEKDETTGKVQPRTRMSDDVWQAVAGSVFNAVNNEDWAPEEKQEHPNSYYEDNFFGDANSLGSMDESAVESFLSESDSFFEGEIS